MLFKLFRIEFFQITSMFVFIFGFAVSQNIAKTRVRVLIHFTKVLLVVVWFRIDDDDNDEGDDIEIAHEGHGDLDELNNFDPFPLAGFDDIDHQGHLIDDAYEESLFHGNVNDHNDFSRDSDPYPLVDAIAYLVEDDEPEIQMETETLEPSANDVLFGRGTRTNIHPGNVRYRDVVNGLKATYKAARSVSETTRISTEVVDSVHAWGGRFLKYDQAIERWVQADFAIARIKAGAALRG